MLTNPPYTGTLTSKHLLCQTPRHITMAGRFASWNPAETGISVTSAAAEYSAVGGGRQERRRSSVTRFGGDLNLEVSG